MMRSLDWSRTPLGPIERWPQSLRTSVSICLNSRFPILIWWGPELVKLYNDAYRDIVGTKHPGAMGARGRDVWPEIWHIIGPMLSSVMERGEATWSENIMLPLERKGFAEECYFTFSYSPIHDESGGVGGVFTAVTETTQQVLSERRLRTLRDLGALSTRAQSESEASRELVQILAQNAADVPDCALLGLDARRSAFDPARVHGLPPDAAGTLLAAAKTALDEADMGVVKNPWEAREGTWALVLPLPASGQDSVLVIGLSPMLPLDEAYRGFLRTVGDQAGAVLANARAFESERRRAEALAELDRARTAFFNNVSHEFRTPLTLMTGPLSDLLEGAHGVVGAEQRQQLELVQRNALRLLKLVNALLDFARIEAGRAEANFESTDLSALTADLASSFRAAIERAGLRFEVSCDRLPQPAYVDREMWEKIVLNLLSNAFKFTFEGTISVSLRAVDGEAVLEVRDTGAGIPESELPRIFERFHRVQGTRSRTHEGSGIGLALVHELVAMHGAGISAESREGEGTSFVIRLPLGSEHLPRERIGASRTLPSTAIGAAAYVQEALRWLPDAGVVAGQPLAAAAQGARILVADDNADMRQYVVRLLSSRWSVEAVADGEAAVAAARRQKPDLILTDVMMAGLDGFGLLREIRRDPALAAVPVIMLSARAGEEARVEGLQAGADDYVVKPFAARELLARVSTHLQLGGARASAERDLERMYALFEQAPVPIAVFFGPDFTYELANPRYLELFRHRNLAGRTLLDVFPELEGTETVEVFRQVWRTGGPYAAREFHNRLRADAGGLEDRWFNFRLQPLRDLEGSEGRMMLVAVEVTDQVRARQRLEEAGRERDVLLAREQQARREAEAANRAKDEFLAILGHELRNPLAPILTAMQILQLKGLAAREAEIVQRQLRHMIRLVDDLLDVSRLARGKIDLKKRAVELAPLVGRAVEMASPLLEQGRHRLQLDVPEGIVLEADPDRLAQVFSNLLMNACKYSPPASRIALSARRDGDAVEVSVRDSGIGIAPSMLDRIFEPFFQQPGSRAASSGGLGLGLTIARNLIQLHGGTIRARSEGEAQGSEFIVRVPALPFTIASGADARSRAVEGNAPGAARVLVVDDNQDAAETLAIALESAGYEVRAAFDGPQALRVADSFAPDVALLDIGLPVMDGYELGAAFRDRFPRIALFAVTGYGALADRERAKVAGFAHHFVKPVDLDDIFAAIRHACAARVAPASG
jgi:signal transduction histidine kinase/DNA-binding response OmpR family regulator